MRHTLRLHRRHTLRLHRPITNSSPPMRNHNKPLTNHLRLPISSRPRRVTQLNLPTRPNLPTRLNLSPHTSRQRRSTLPSQCPITLRRNPHTRHRCTKMPKSTTNNLNHSIVNHNTLRQADNLI